jgi:hypothetical protein
MGWRVSTEMVIDDPYKQNPGQTTVFTPKQPPSWLCAACRGDYQKSVESLVEELTPQRKHKRRRRNSSHDMWSEKSGREIFPFSPSTFRRNTTSQEKTVVSGSRLAGKRVPPDSVHSSSPFPWKRRDAMRDGRSAYSRETAKATSKALRKGSGHGMKRKAPAAAQCMTQTEPMRKYERRRSSMDTGNRTAAR